ncbi:MAG TPA: MraY family glycosyltransferase [Geminicoccaceae bacterium]|nr:MraY family glycosyltransferase [Geminicoccaceae bacterium]
MMFSIVWFGLSVVTCCSLATPLGRILGVIDYPDGGRHGHARPTPLVGGIALMVPLFLVALAEAVWYGPSGGIFLILAAAGFGFLLLGWYDDRDHVPPGIRLLISASLCGALVLMQSNLLLTAIDLAPDHAVRLGIIALPFTIICLVGLQNAINMADGMNGLVIGLAAFWAGSLMLYAPDPLQLYLRFMLLGLLILLPFNLRDSLFLGDAGSYSIGATIGLLMIYCFNEADGQLPMLTVVLWLFVPVADCLRVMVTRLLRDRSPMLGDRNHLHHRLKRRWDSAQSLVIYLGIAGVPGLVAAIWPMTTELMLTVVVAAYSGILWLTRRNVAATRSSPGLV